MYTSHIARAAEAAASGGSHATSHEAMIRLVANYAATGTGGNGRPVYAQPTVSVSRRPPVEMTLPLSKGGGGHAAAEDPAIDFSSPIDVPAFLRRQN